MDIQKKIINRNYTVGRANQIPHIVVIHTTDGFGRNNYNWFNNPNSKTSAHFGVMLDGTVEQYVDIDNTAWHAGDWNINLISIGIEHDDNRNPNDSVRTGELYRSSIQLICFLIDELEKKYPNKFTASASQEFINNFIRIHREFSPGRTCPGGLDVNRIKQGVLNCLLEREKKQNLTINIINMQQQIEQLQKQISELNENVQNLLTTKNNLEMDVSSLTSLKLSLEIDNKVLSEKAEKLKNEINKKENALNSILLEIDKRKKEINDFKNASVVDKTNFVNLTAKIIRFLKNLFFKKLK